MAPQRLGSQDRGMGQTELPHDGVLRSSRSLPGQSSRAPDRSNRGYGANMYPFIRGRALLPLGAERRSTSLSQQRSRASEPAWRASPLLPAQSRGLLRRCPGSPPTPWSGCLIDGNLEGANVTDEQLEQAKSLEGATMPNSQKYEESLKSKDRKENGKSSGSS